MQYVQIRNGCGRRIKLFPRFPKPTKGRAHAPGPIELSPDAVSTPVLLGAVVDCDGWAEVKDCISLENVAGAPTFISIRASKRKPIKLRLKLKRTKGARASVKVIRISEKARVISQDALASPSEVKKLEKQSLVTLKQVFPVYLPSSYSYGYEDSLYLCRDCGRPIVFRGSPPRPIHV